MTQSLCLGLLMSRGHAKVKVDMTTAINISSLELSKDTIPWYAAAVAACMRPFCLLNTALQNKKKSANKMASAEQRRNTATNVVLAIPQHSALTLAPAIPRHTALTNLPTEVRACVLWQLSNHTYFAAITASPTLRLVSRRKYNQRRWQRHGADVACSKCDYSGIAYLRSIGELQPSTSGFFSAAFNGMGDLIEELRSMGHAGDQHISWALFGAASANVKHSETMRAARDVLVERLLPTARNRSMAWLAAALSGDVTLAQRLLPNPGWDLLLHAIKRGALNICYAVMERVDRDDRSMGPFGLDTKLPWDILAMRAIKYGHEKLALAIIDRKRIMPCAITSSLMHCAAAHNSHAIIQWCLDMCPPRTSDNCHGAAWNLAHARDATLLREHVPHWPPKSAHWTSWARAAACVGNLDAAKWLLAHEGISSEANVVRKIHMWTLWMAVTSGHVHVVKRFVLGQRLAHWHDDNHAGMASRIGKACGASKLARLAALEPLVDFVPPQAFIDAVAKHRRGACRLLCEHGVTRDLAPFTAAFEAAIIRGDLTMARYLWCLPTSFPHLWANMPSGSEQPPSLPLWWQAARAHERHSQSDIAIVSGKLEMVRFLDRAGAICFTPDTMDDAAARGLLAIVAYLHMHRCEGCTNQAMARAAVAGHYGVIKFLAEYRSEGCPSNTRTKAATSSRVVRLLRAYGLRA